MKILKSKTFIICFAVAIFLAVFTFLSPRLGAGNFLGGVVKTVVKPVEWAGSKFADAYLGFSSVFSEYDRLREENEELKNRLAELENQDHELEVIKNENRWLKEYLSIAENNPSFRLEDAVIISRESGSYATVLTLNRGALHGVKNRMPVITDLGVFGYVKETGPDWCKVVSVVELQGSVGVITERAGVLGTAVGDGTLRLDGLCQMIHIAADSDIRVGDIVLTSGSGTVYPYGLPLGTVVAIEADEYSRELVATIKPSVDFINLFQINRVMIIKGYEQSEDE